MTDLTGRTALVTGAGAGIGRAIAEALGGAGARVGVNVMGNRAGGEATLASIRAAGGDGIVLQGDITVPGEAKVMAQDLLHAFGPVDILVNNSGIGSPGNPDTALEIGLEDWDRVMAVNVRGALQCVQACLPGMIALGRGAIVNVASVRGVTAARGLAAYSASKGAILSLTQQMALDYARSGIRVNAVSPGFVESEMLKGYIHRQPDPEAAHAVMAGTAALGRIGQPHEIADAVLFLVSDDASFITGANLIVDGGGMANGLRSFL